MVEESDCIAGCVRRRADGSYLGSVGRNGEVGPEHLAEAVVLHLTGGDAEAETETVPLEMFKAAAANSKAPASRID